MDSTAFLNHEAHLLLLRSVLFVNDEFSMHLSQIK